MFHVSRSSAARQTSAMGSHPGFIAAISAPRASLITTHDTPELQHFNGISCPKPALAKRRVPAEGRC